MPDKVGLVGMDHGRGGRRHWSWRGLGCAWPGPAAAGSSVVAQAGVRADTAGGAREEETGTEELEAPGMEWEQVMQVWEQDVSATDEALSDLRGAGELAGKRKRGDKLAHLPVRNSLWEQDSLEAYNEVLLGCLDSEVGALRQRKAEYVEARRLSEGSDSCWSDSDSGSGSEVVLEASIEPLALDGGVVVITQGGEVEGAAVEPSATEDGEAQASLAPVLAPVVHQMWEASMVRAYNEVLGGELQPEVELLQGVEARWAEEPGSDHEEELLGGGWAGCPAAWWQGICNNEEEDGEGRAVWRNHEEVAPEWGWPGWGEEKETEAGDAGEVCTRASRWEVVSQGVQHQPWWH